MAKLPSILAGNNLGSAVAGARSGSSSSSGSGNANALRNASNQLSPTNDLAGARTRASSYISSVVSQYTRDKKIAVTDTGNGGNQPIGTTPQTTPTAFNSQQSREAATTVLTNLLRQYGFSASQIASLSGEINQRISEGYDPDIIMSAFIPNSSAYKERFKANEARVQRGLNPLTESQYISLENGYRSALSRFGMPTSLFDSNDDFAAWIRDDVSVDEIGSRAKLYSDLANSSNQQITAFKNYYGISAGEAGALFFMDRSRSEQYLEKIYNASAIGAEAIRAGLEVGRNFSEGLVEQGVNAGRAREGFNFAVENKDTFSKLDTIDKANNAGLTTADLINTGLGLDANASKKVKRLASQERARFAGSNAGSRILGENLGGSF